MPPERAQHTPPLRPGQSLGDAGTSGNLHLPALLQRSGEERVACDLSFRNCQVGLMLPGRGLAVTSPRGPCVLSAGSRGEQVFRRPCPH